MPARAARLALVGSAALALLAAPTAAARADQQPTYVSYRAIASTSQTHVVETQRGGVMTARLFRDRLLVSDLDDHGVLHRGERFVTAFVELPNSSNAVPGHPEKLRGFFGLPETAGEHCTVHFAGECMVEGEVGFAPTKPCPDTRYDFGPGNEFISTRTCSAEMIVSDLHPLSEARIARVKVWVYSPYTRRWSQLSK